MSYFGALDVEDVARTEPGAVCRVRRSNAKIVGRLIISRQDAISLHRKEKACL
jgi:hypothetical protein